MNMGAVACPLCGSNAQKERRTDRAFYHIWRCSRCRLEWIDRNDLTKPEATPSYENYGYNLAIMEEFGRMKAVYLKGFRQRIDRTVGSRGLSNCAFLDVGCANGEYLWTARQLGFGHVSGVEIDSVAAGHAGMYGDVFNDVRELSHSYDVIQIKNVLTNIPDIIAFMAPCLEVLKPNGFLFIDVLNQDSFGSLLRHIFRRKRRYGYLRPPYVINGFNRTSIAMLFWRLRLVPTLVSTSFVGSSSLPYSASFLPRAVGVTGKLLGRGSMLITESRRDSTPCARS